MEVQLTKSKPNDFFKNQRDELSIAILQARTLPEIEATKRELHEWLRAHPNEQGMRDGFEALSHAEDFAHAQAAGLYPSWEVIDAERAKEDQRLADLIRELERGDNESREGPVHAGNDMGVKV